jgi:hypothetical protein
MTVWFSDAAWQRMFDQAIGRSHGGLSTKFIWRFEAWDDPCGSCWRRLKRVTHKLPLLTCPRSSAENHPATPIICAKEAVAAIPKTLACPK